MAKIKLNPLLEFIRGKIDKAVFRRTHTGEVILSKSPDMSEVVWSEAQEAHRARFRRAVKYAREALADPELKAFYLQMSLEVKNSRRPFDMAVSDYFKGNNLVHEKLLRQQSVTSPHGGAARQT